MMKQRNFFKSFLMFGTVFALLLSLSGCPNKLDPKINTVKISFDEATVKCEKKAGDSWTALKNGAEAVEGETLKFSAILPSGKLVDKWTIGKTIVENKETVDYTVKKDDIGSENTISVSVTLKDKPKPNDPSNPGTPNNPGNPNQPSPSGKVKIIFDKDKIRCSIASNPINTNSEVNAGEKIRFSAVNLPSGKAVNEWKANDKTIRNPYTVNTADADSSGNITITYTEKDVQTVRITFDNSSIGCFKNGQGSIRSGDTVNEGDLLLIWAENLPGGKAVKEWKAGTRVIERSIDKVEIWYKVALGDSVAGEINISYELKDAEDLTLRFDETKVEGLAWVSGTARVLRTGDTIKEQTKIRLKAVGLSDTEAVNEWTLGNKKESLGNTNIDIYDISLLKKYADASGVVNISYTVKETRSFKIEFDGNKIQASHADTGMHIGNKVKEGVNLRFWAKNLNGAEILNWTAGSKTINSSKEWIYYNVATADANSEGVIKIDYETKPLETVKIKFDSSKLECRDTNSWAEVHDGDTVFVRTHLRFIAKDLTGTEIVSWKIGTKTINNSEERIDYIVEKADANSEGVIEVGYTTKPLETVKIKFDPSKLECRIWKNGSEEQVHDGDTVTKNQQLYFTSITTQHSNDKVADNWKAGTRIISQGGQDRLDYTVDKNDADPYTNEITVTCGIRDVEDITIKFDPSKLSAEFDESGTFKPLTNGGTVKEKVALRFTASPTAGKVVRHWKIGSSLVAQELPNIFRLYYMTKKYLDGAPELVISYEERDKENVTIEFTNPNIKITQPDNGNAILTSGTQVPEGTRLKFETIDGKSVHWKMNVHFNLSNSKVNVVEYEIFKLNGKNTITISYEE